MSDRSASAAEDQATGGLCSAMALVLLAEEMGEGQRPSRVRLERAGALVDLDAKLQQLLDVGEQLPAHAFLIRRGQARQGFDGELDRFDHGCIPRPALF